MKAGFLYVFLLSLCSIASLKAQSHYSTVYFELGGSGGVASINAEKTFLTRTGVQSGLRIGFSLAPIDRNNGTGLVFPIHLYTLIGKANNQVDLGIGQGLTLTTKGSVFALGNLVVGWRHTFKNENWFLRMAYTPLISYITDFQWHHWAGISVGYRFKK